MSRREGFESARRDANRRRHDDNPHTHPCQPVRGLPRERLSSPLQLDQRQMFATGQVADFEIETNAAPATNGRPRRSTRGTARPASSRLEPRREASGVQTMVDLVGSPTVERLTRAIVVVPGHEQRQLPSEVLSTVGDQQLPGALTFEGPNQPLDNSDAAVFADRTFSAAVSN